MRELIARDQVGLGWRTPLAASIFTHLDSIDVVEVIADDYFDVSARVLRSIRSLGKEVPLIAHGVTLGLASVVRVATRRVDCLAKVINAIEPALWSEHLAFVRGGGYEIGHLAAPPRNDATVAGTLHNLAVVRRVVGTPPALENIATLIDPPDSPLPEPDWVSGIITESQCPLLLDLHNLLANAVNFGHDPLEYLLDFPLEKVSVVHISGGQWVTLDAATHGLAARRLLDDHLHDVPDPVYALLTELGRRCTGFVTVILERDGRYPDFQILLRQLQRAREALELGRAQALGSGCRARQVDGVVHA